MTAARDDVGVSQHFAVFGKEGRKWEEVANRCLVPAIEVWLLVSSDRFRRRRVIDSWNSQDTNSAELAWADAPCGIVASCYAVPAGRRSGPRGYGELGGRVR